MGSLVFRLSSEGAVASDFCYTEIVESLPL